jgi:nucleoside-diphosphate-sugar epimerase
VTAALERGRPGEAYNIVDDEACCIGDHIRTMARAVGARPPVELPGWTVRLTRGLLAAQLTNNLAASNAKAEAELGWAPAHPTVADGLQELRAA